MTNRNLGDKLLAALALPLLASFLMAPTDCGEKNDTRPADELPEALGGACDPSSAAWSEGYPQAHIAVDLGAGACSTGSDYSEDGVLTVDHMADSGTAMASVSGGYLVDDVRPSGSVNCEGACIDAMEEGTPTTVSLVGSHEGEDVHLDISLTVQPTGLEATSATWTFGDAE